MSLKRRKNNAKSGWTPVAWALRNTRSGWPVSIIGDLQAYRTHDPRNEAQAVAAQVAKHADKYGHDYVVVPASNLGYLPAAIARQTGRPGIVFDDMRHMPIREKFPYPIVRTAWEFRDAIAKAKANGMCTKPVVAVPPIDAQAHRWTVEFANTYIRQQFGKDPSCIEDKISSPRGMGALERTATHKTVADFYGHLVGKVVVIAHGPSLDLELVKRLQDNGAVIITMSQSLGKLNSAGIVPDFAFSADPQPEHFAQFACYPKDPDKVQEWRSDGLVDYRSMTADESIDDFEAREVGHIVCDTMADPRLYKKFGDRCVSMHLRSSHVQDVAWRRLGLPILEDNPALISVYECAVTTAYWWGCRRMLLIGANWGEAEKTGKCTWPARAVDGGVCWTYSHLYQASRYMDMWCHDHPEVEMARISWGLPVEHLDQLEPEDADDFLFGTRAPIPEFSGGPQPDAARRAEVCAQVAREAIEHADPTRGAEGYSDKLPKAIQRDFTSMSVDGVRAAAERMEGM